MKITVAHKNLRRGVGFAERVTSKNSSLPILSNILLRTENGRLKISATNLEVGIHAVIGANIEESGEVAVPGRILAELLSATNDDTLTLTTKGDTLTVSSPSYTTSILCQEAKEYPIIPKIVADPVLRMGGQDLGGAFAVTLDSIAVSESRPELSGMFFRVDEQGIVCAATDGFRLVEKRVAVKGLSKQSVIVPRSTVAELVRLSGESSGDVEVRIGDNQISFLGDDFELISRIIDGRYPDYTRVIPEKSVSRALVPRSAFEKAIRTVAPFSSNISDIKLAIADDILSVATQNTAKGSANATAAGILKGDAFEASMNYHYILDGLKVIPEEEIVIEFTGKGAPIVFRPHNDNSATTYLIMPLRA